MEKIKKIFSGMVNSVKETLKKFPITTIIVFMISVIVALFVIDSDFSKEIKELISHVVIILSYTAVGTWLVEVVFEDKKDRKRIIGYFISFIIAVIIDRIIEIEIFSEKTYVRWLGEYILVCFLASVYILVKRLEISFEKYILNLVLNIKRSSIICGIISIGFVILYSIFTILILDSIEFSIVIRMLCLFAGFYYVPVVMNAFANEEAEDTKFNKAVFTKVLLSLIVLAMVIVYIYIVKIFFVTEVPKNELFTILSLIFVCAFPIYVINKNYSEKGTLLYKVNSAIPYLYIPFIFLQIYSMGIRINTYGLTTSRYMAIVLIVYEIIAIALATLKGGEKLKYIVPVTLGISIIVTISPFNYETLPKLNQKKIVDKYIIKGVQFDDLGEKDKAKFAGAYQYIENDEIYSDNLLSQLEKEKLSSYNTRKYSSNSYVKNNEKEYVNLHKDFDGVNISKYNKIYEVTSYTSGQSANITYVGEENGINIKINLEDYAKKIIESNEISEATAKRIFEETEFVSINGDFDLFITEFSMRYKKDSQSLNYIRIKGFLLQK